MATQPTIAQMKQALANPTPAVNLQMANEAAEKAGQHSNPHTRSLQQGWEHGWYHGSTGDIKSFRPDLLGESTGAASAKKGYFFARDPSTPPAHMVEHDPQSVEMLTKLGKPIPANPTMAGHGAQTAGSYAGTGGSREYKEAMRKARAAEKSGKWDDYEKYMAEAEDSVSNEMQYRQGLVAKHGDARDEMLEKINNAWYGAQNADKFKKMSQGEYEAHDKLHKELMPYGWYTSPLYDDKMYQNLIGHISSATGGKHSKEAIDAIKKYRSVHNERKAADVESGANILPVALRYKNPMYHDFQGKSYRDQTYSDLMDEAKRKGHDALILKNTYDPGGSGGVDKMVDVGVVFHPHQIRSKFAAFHPDRGNESDLLAARGGPIHMAGGGQPDEDYRGSHQAPGPDFGAPMHDVTRDMYPADFYSPNGLRYYADQSEPKDRDAYNKVVRVKNKPNEMVAIHRAVPTSVYKEALKKDSPLKHMIRKGDWVAIHKDYAKEHGDNVLGKLNKDYKIASMRVPAKHVWTNADSIHEWGYHPEENKAKGGPIKLAGGGQPPSLDVMKLALTKHGMYSPLEKATMGVNRTKGTPAEFMAEASKQPGFRKDEVSDRNLQLPDQKLTKAEMLQHLQKSPMPSVSEHVLHDFGDEEDALQHASQAIYGQDYDEVYDDRKAREKVENYVKKHQAKYQDYQLPGGKNYREVLLQTPHFAEHDEHRIMELEADKRRSPQPSHWGMTTGEAKELADLMKRKAGMGEQYHSSHFEGHPNILAHMRMSDREAPGEMGYTLVNKKSGLKSPHFSTPEEAKAALEAYPESIRGSLEMKQSQGPKRKLLHIEEIQSDWHQEGRKRGYKQKDPLQKNKDGHWTYTRPDGAVIDLGENIDEQLFRQSAGNKVGSVPDAPFKKNWHELALKHALHHAAKHGYHGVVITPGQEQADRYDLSKQIDAVSVSPTGDGQYRIDAQIKGGGTKTETNLDANGVEAMIGKELASKLITAADARLKSTAAMREVAKSGDDAEYDRLREARKELPPTTLSGLDLKVGGEGMKGFYDKIVPDYLNKLGKPHGVKVGKTKIPAPQRGEPYTMGDVMQHHGMNEEQWRNAPIRQREDLQQQFANQRGTTELHHFPITEPMRQQILQGQPMYKQGGIIHKAEGGNVQPNIAQMRMALQQRNPIEAQNIGVNEAPNMLPKIYFSPSQNENDDPTIGNSFNQDGMPIGGVDQDQQQPGQQLMAQQQPGQPPQGAQPPQGGLTPQGGPQIGPQGPTPPMGNMLSITPQGQTMQALAPQGPPGAPTQPAPTGMADGGGVTVAGATGSGGFDLHIPINVGGGSGGGSSGGSGGGISSIGGMAGQGNASSAPSAAPAPQLATPYGMYTNRPQFSAPQQNLSNGMGSAPAPTSLGSLAGLPGGSNDQQIGPPAITPTSGYNPVTSNPIQPPSLMGNERMYMPWEKQPDPNQINNKPVGNYMPPDFSQLNLGNLGKQIDVNNIPKQTYAQYVAQHENDIANSDLYIGPTMSQDDWQKQQPTPQLVSGMASGGVARHAKGGSAKETLHFPPSPALMKHEIEAHAERMARQVAGLDNPNKKSIKQLAREQTLPLGITKGGKKQDVPIIDFEKQKGAYSIGVPGDPSRGGLVPASRNAKRYGIETPKAGEYLKSIGGEKLESPVPMYGGKDYGAYGHPEGWASDLGASAGMFNIVKRLHEEDPTREIYGHYHKMSPESLNHAVHMMDAVLSHHRPHESSAEHIAALNHLMRNVATTTGKNDVRYPEFPGFENPSDVMFHGSLNSAMRKKMLGILGKDKYFPGGKQKMEDIIYAMSHPELRNIETGAGGSSILKFDPTRELRQNISSHPTYGHDIPSRLVGRTRYITPAEILAPRSMHNAKEEIKAMGKAVLPFNMAKMSIIREPIDEQYINQMGEYEHGMKKRLGYKKGGDVKLAPTQDTMRLALTKKKAK